MRFVLAFLAMVFAGSVGASDRVIWTEPARGTADRAGMMDALRPHAERFLGAPVQFVIQDIRMFEKTGFASVVAQRPGGAAIDITKTPGFLDGHLDPQFMDGTTLQALYQKSGDTWVAVHWEIGATDVWYADFEAFCDIWFGVLYDFCSGGEIRLGQE